MVGVLYDVWVPITMAEAMDRQRDFELSRDSRHYLTFVRLKPGASLEQGRKRWPRWRGGCAAYPGTTGIERRWCGVAGHWCAGILLRPLTILMRGRSAAADGMRQRSKPVPCEAVRGRRNSAAAGAGARQSLAGSYLPRPIDCGRGARLGWF